MKKIFLIGLFYFSFLIYYNISTQHDYYLLFIPIGIVVAGIATSTGIAGSIFWIPIYLLFGLDNYIIFWISLITMLFGFGSGAINHIYQKNIDVNIIKNFLFLTIYGGIIGCVIVLFINAKILLIVFGINMMLYGIINIHENVNNISDNKNTFNNNVSILAFICGIINGMIAVGLELTLQGMDKKDIKKYIGSLIVIYFITNIFVVVLKILIDDMLIFAVRDNFMQICSIISIVGPSVILGGYIRPKIVNKLSVKLLLKYIGFVMICIGIFSICVNLYKF